ncbi:hypothetical protein V7O61_14310 [Methanolobus sp. WCC1]
MRHSIELIFTFISAEVVFLKDTINVAKEIHSIRITTIVLGPFT